MGTSIVLPSIENMIHDLNTSTIMVNISIGIYLLSMGIFPLWWSSFSEKFGRRSVYVISFTLYLGFCLGCALSPSINALIVFRVLTGGCSASVQSVGAGTISDLYAPEHRGRALGYYYLGVLMAPLISPIIGALLLVRWDWRSTQWFMVIFAFVTVLLIICFLPETLRVQDNKAFIAQILAERRVYKQPHDEESNAVNNEEEENQQIERILSRASRANSAVDLSKEGPHEVVVPEMYANDEPRRDEMVLSVRQNDLKKYRSEVESIINESQLSKAQNLRKYLHEFLIKPLKAVYFLKYPPVFFAIFFSSISFGILYLVNMTIEYEFARAPYNWKSLYVGFAYIPNSITYILASVYGGKWTDHLLKKYREKHGFNAPEARISYNILSAVVTFPIALLIIGWCFHFHTFWVTPLIGTAIFGYASMMTIGPVVTYLVDSLPGRGATGVALNNLVRQTLATIAVFVTDPLIKGMGTGPLYSMLTGVVLLSSLSLVIIKKRGTYWRENYDLQKLYDSLD
jgi:multidrug resistance protein